MGTNQVIPKNMFYIESREEQIEDEIYIVNCGSRKIKPKLMFYSFNIWTEKLGIETIVLKRSGLDWVLKDDETEIKTTNIFKKIIKWLKR